MRNFSEKWFTRHQGSVKGPFTVALLRSNLAQGRLAESAEVSQDLQLWQPLKQVLAVAASGKHSLDDASQPAEHQLVEEREGFDRRTGIQATTSAERLQRKKRRRAREKSQVIRARQLRTRRMQVMLLNKEDWFWPIFSVCATVAVLFMVALLYPTKLPMPDVNCDAAPKAAVNWENCIKLELDLTAAHLRNANLRNTQLSGSRLTYADLQATDLSYADLQRTDLSYADLRAANFKGSDLQQADLSNSVLTGANLSFADLRGANLAGSDLENALFDHAIWIDGRQCAADSRGECR